MRDNFSFTLEALLDYERLVVPTEHARLDDEALKGEQRAFVADRLRDDDGIPAFLADGCEETGALHEIDARDVHHREIAAVVHVDQHIEIRRQHGERRAAWAEHGDGTAKARKDRLPQQAQNQIHVYRSDRVVVV